MAESILNNRSRTDSTIFLSATELSALSTSDRTALYQGGARQLIVENGDTITNHVLKEDGSTVWLGSNKPVRNLLDNSDFTNPVNQRGQTSYAGSGYSIDRWKSWVDSNTLTIGNGCIITNGKYAQYVEGLSDSEYSAFAMQSDGTLIQIGTGYESANNWRYAALPAGTYKWAALYEGSYTAETLPPYTPKGYAAELAECQRYYKILYAPNSVYDVVLNGMITDDSKVVAVNAPITNMRITPTATLNGSIIIRGIAGYINDSYSGVEANVSAKKGAIMFEKKDGTSYTKNVTNNTPIQVNLTAGSKIELSADL